MPSLRRASPSATSSTPHRTAPCAGARCASGRPLCLRSARPLERNPSPCSSLPPELPGMHAAGPYQPSPSSPPCMHAAGPYQPSPSSPPCLAADVLVLRHRRRWCTRGAPTARPLVRQCGHKGRVGQRHHHPGARAQPPSLVDTAGFAVGPTPACEHSGLGTARHTPTSRAQPTVRTGRARPARHMSSGTSHFHCRSSSSVHMRMCISVCTCTMREHLP